MSSPSQIWKKSDSKSDMKKKVILCDKLVNNGIGTQNTSKHQQMLVIKLNLALKRTEFQDF